MKTETQKQLEIKLKGDDIDNLKSALKKISAEQKKIGFNKSSLSEDEAKVISKLSDEINK